MPNREALISAHCAKEHVSLLTSLRLSVEPSGLQSRLEASNMHQFCQCMSLNFGERKEAMHEASSLLGNVPINLLSSTSDLDAVMLATLAVLNSYFW